MIGISIHQTSNLRRVIGPVINVWSQSEAALAHQQLILLITDIIEHFELGFVQSTMANQLALDQCWASRTRATVRYRFI